MGAKGAQTADTVDDREQGDGSAGEKAGAEADDEGVVVLVDAVNHPDNLQNAETSEGGQ